MIDQLRAEIAALRAETGPLEPDSEERRALAGKAVDHALNFLDRVEDSPSLRPASDVFTERLEPEFAEHGRRPESVLDYD